MPMLSKFDISRLQDLPIEQVAEALQITVSRHKALCPFHDDSRPSLTFNCQRNRYRCFVCDASGGPIDLVMNSQGWKFYESCKWMAGRFGVTLDCGEGLRTATAKGEGHPSPKNPSPSTRNPSPLHLQPEIDLHYLEGLMANPYLNDQARSFLFDERKIAPWVARQCGLGSISMPVPMSGNPNGPWFNAPSLLIPYRDIDGKLLSVQARYLGEGSRGGGRNATVAEENPFPKPRFQFPKGSQCHIFNLQVLRTLTEGEALWITEGVSDCLAVMSSGRKAIAIPSATLLKAEDVVILQKGIPSPSPESPSPLILHMIPDNDEPGEKLFLQLQRLCPDIVHHQLPERFKDFGEYWRVYAEPVECLH